MLEHSSRGSGSSIGSDDDAWLRSAEEASLLGSGEEGCSLRLPRRLPRRAPTEPHSHAAKMMPTRAMARARQGVARGGTRARMARTEA